MTFWDSLALDLNNALTEVTTVPVIIIIASAKVTSWLGTNHTTPQIETRFYLNYDYHDVVNLRKMYDFQVYLSKKKFIQYIIMLEQ